jgi:hypothetical protein
MSEAANMDLAKRWFEKVWNQGRESAIDELFHPQGKAYGFSRAGFMELTKMTLKLRNK